MVSKPDTSTHRNRRSRWIVALICATLAPSCREQTSNPQVRPEETAHVPSYPELPWPDVVQRIESGDVTWIVPVSNQRVFVTMKSGAEHATTAPSNAALDALLRRVDPSGRTIVVARKYASYQEIVWRDIPALLTRNSVWVVQQNGGRRVFIETVDEETGPAGFYVTLQPHPGDITQLVPKKYPNGRMVKHIDVREISWPKALDELALDNVSGLFLAHGDLVYLSMKDRRTLLTVNPSGDELTRWLKTYRPDFDGITVE